ncbi:ABC transporter ATP-binding protein [Pontivivens insulae]|uniref:Lipopolysaccharide export system ATP-binding protein LptB n=1 Tax=Pontivivens insulae TaxID=1639689 RepID=A0A2R8A7E8_9RHOB|nr:ABC transporter ATP-binding protein [Pontivivens insulae]RED18228.1 amino acid/amide ABC transporter ATP-binding protein 1 (HAAT family) [Pontivivens insulae]SPF28126.1 Lipopolysaccharide export system ATP-binding protein LptB [Pontivivens insulae]
MTEPVLETRGITKHFGALVASDAVSLDLHAGEIHAVIGPNGAGKSTLIAQICGALTPDAGTVHLEGQDVTALSTAERAEAGIARTFQISSLAMEDTVLQNTMLGALGAAGKRPSLFRPILRDRALRALAEAALEQVGLAERRAVRVADLSHGQRRQLEVAVALAQAPKAFVMDEPMAGLGTSGTHDLTALLDGLRTQAPILLVEHDMDAVFALADRISVLVYGRIIATGSVEDIRRDSAVRDAYLGDAA